MQDEIHKLEVQVQKSHTECNKLRREMDYLADKRRKDMGEASVNIQTLEVEVCHRPTIRCGYWGDEGQH